MVVDDSGEPVWFRATPHVATTNLRAATLNGKPVLTWWQGGLIVGDGRGVGLIYDDRYRRVKTVRAGNGYAMDLHEFTITPDDTALIIAFDRVEQDLRSLGGPRRGIVITAIVQEVEIATGLVRFEYHSLGSIGLDEGKAPLPKKDGGQYDYIHMNSVALDDNGSRVLRNRHAIAEEGFRRVAGVVAAPFVGHSFFGISLDRVDQILLRIVRYGLARELDRLPRVAHRLDFVERGE